MRPPSVRQITALVRKDLRRESRTWEVTTSTVAFSILLVAVFAFAFYRREAANATLLPGTLWVAILFAGNLVFERTFDHETSENCLRALSLVPRSSGSLFVAKLSVNILFVLAFEVVLFPLLALVFDADVFGQWPHHTLVLLGGTVGFAALGTLVSAMLVENRLRKIFLPLVLYPLAVPILLIGIVATRDLVTGGPGASAWAWLRVLLALDVVYTGLGYLVFGFVLDAVE